MSVCENMTEKTQNSAQVVCDTVSKLESKAPRKRKSKTKKTTRSTEGMAATASKWTEEEKKVLLGIVSKKGASIKHFEGALPGRSGLACYVRWRVVIMPSMLRTFVEEEKAVGRKRKS